MTGLPAGECRARWVRLVDEVTPGATLRAVRPLAGGIAAHAFELETSARTLVVKRYAAGDDTATLEWERLTAVQALGLTSPNPLAVDTDGRWFDVPTLVMSRLPGAPDLHPADLDAWLAQVAQTLVTIHETDVPTPAPVLRRPLATLEWRPRASSSDSELVASASAAITHELPHVRWPPRLIHGDFHPGNLLWEHGRLTGVVDWSAARMGPRWYELAYCRTDVALLFGARAADRLAEAYRTRSTEAPEHLRAFDLMAGLLALREVAQRVTDYRTQGATVRLPQARANLEAFVHAALLATASS